MLLATILTKHKVLGIVRITSLSGGMNNQKLLGKKIKKNYQNFHSEIKSMAMKHSKENLMKSALNLKRLWIARNPTFIKAFTLQ